MSSEEIAVPPVDFLFGPLLGELPYLAWQVQASSATVIANADDSPYLTVKQYGKGYFIYIAAMQPVIGHGGFAPSTYSYTMFRNAIEWAFESVNRPIAKLSPWPYQYNAAINFRHDMEAIPARINAIEGSAQYEACVGSEEIIISAPERCGRIMIQPIRPPRLPVCSGRLQTMGRWLVRTMAG